MTLISIAAITWVSGWLAGLYAGSRHRSRADHEWRRSFSHENTNQPRGDPPLKLKRSSSSIRLDPGTVQRGNGGNNPTAPKPTIIPKPQFPAPRTIHKDFL